VLGERVVRGALRDGVLAQPWRGVVVDGKRNLHPLTRAAAGLLAGGAGAVLSRNTAAALQGCTAATSVDVHITVPYTNWVRSKPGLVVHHDRFDEDEVILRDGLPVLPLVAAVTDLLCAETRWVALACLDQALAGLSDIEAGAFIADVDRRLVDRDDRRGIRAAEGLLCLGTGLAESPQESRLRLLVTDSGFPNPVPQHKIVTLDGRLLFRLDLAWPELRIALEYDGYEAHEGRQRNDAERDLQMAGRGWQVIRVRKGDLADPAPFLGALRQAFRERRYPLGA
jgi:hypothetical protein